MPGATAGVKRWDDLVRVSATGRLQRDWIESFYCLAVCCTRREDSGYNSLVSANRQSRVSFNPGDAPGRDDKGTELSHRRYRADLTSGSLKLRESRIVADMLLQGADEDRWRHAIIDLNVLQAKSRTTAVRLSNFIRARLETTGPELWQLVRDGEGTVAVHAAFAAAVKHSPLLGDFLRLVVQQQYRLFTPALSNAMFTDYLSGCLERDPSMTAWSEETRARVRSSVFQMLAQAGYIENTRSLRLQHVHIAGPVVQYLTTNHEDDVLRCLQVSP